jgi:sugar-specific transcriptional regulator TrmB
MSFYSRVVIMKQVHKEIKQFLSELGLTPTEISIYVTNLQFGKQTTAELAKRSGIKRTTTYSALASLIEKGVVGMHTQSGSRYFTATDPHLIERSFVTKIENLKKQQLDFINLLPLFEDLTSQAGGATEVASFHGEKGVRTAVDAALYCVSRKWKIIAPEKNYFSESDKEYAEYFIKIRTQRNIRATSLWEPAFVKKRTFNHVDFEFRNPRVLPQQLVGKFRNTLIIFDSSVLFISSANEATAVLIKSAEIKETMEVFFDGLWLAAKPIPQKNIRKN